MDGYRDCDDAQKIFVTQSIVTNWDVLFTCIIVQVRTLKCKQKKSISSKKEETLCVYYVELIPGCCYSVGFKLSNLFRVISVLFVVNQL